MKEYRHTWFHELSLEPSTNGRVVDLLSDIPSFIQQDPEVIEKTFYEVCENMQSELEHMVIALQTELRTTIDWGCFDGFFREEAEDALRRSSESFSFPQYRRLCWIRTIILKKTQECSSLRKVGGCLRCS